MPDPIDAQNAALDAYNLAVNRFNDSRQRLDDLSQMGRPPDDKFGQDAGGKEYDLKFKQAQETMLAAQAQAASASTAYATILQQQSAQAAKSNTPEGVALADKNQALAQYYQAKADGFAAKDEAARQAAQTRAETALSRANTAASRVDAQNAQANASAANSNASAASTAARTPAEIAQAEASAAASNASAASTAARTPAEVAAAQAQANAANANAANVTARTPAEIAAAQAQANASNASAVDAVARANLADLQAQQLASNDPLVKAHLQAQIDQLQTQTSNLGKPSLEPGYQNADKIPMIVKGPDDKWTVEWVPNNGQQMTATAALRQLGDTIGLNLGDGPGQIPLQTAKDLFSIANDTYRSQTDRQQANNQGAQIGAGLLQGRQNNVNSQENTLLGLANNKNFGLGGPLPAGLWQGVHNEVLGNMTQAGGGQSTYETAMALVHQAAPQLQGTPAGAGHVAVVQQMLDSQNQPAPTQTPPAPSPSPSFQAPVTQIAPDGTITVQHTPMPETEAPKSSFQAPETVEPQPSGRFI